MLVEEAFSGTCHGKSLRRCGWACRYYAPDPEEDFGEGYEGKQVVVENLRQLCVHRVANESGRPWAWWDFAMDYKLRCSMKEKKYSKACAEEVVASLGLSLEKVLACMGDPDADADNAVLSKEQEDQIGRGSRGDVTILPTLVINDVQYRGKLERTAVLKAVCAGFKEGTEPQVCLSHDMETNECLHRNGGCWRDEATNMMVCRDTYRGRVCECPMVNGVRYDGDGYTHCKGRLHRHTKFTGHSCGRTKFQLYCNPSRSIVAKDGAPQLFDVMPKEQTMSLTFFERPTYHLAAAALEWLHLQMGDISTCSWEKSRPAPGRACHCHLGPPPTAGAAVPRPFNYATSAVQYILEKKKKQH